MFERFKQKSQEEKKKTLKTAGKVTLGLAGAAALGWIVGNANGFKSGINTFLEFGLKLDDREKEKLESEEDDEDEGEA